MSSVTPLGIVKTTPFGTITFPLTVALDINVQVELTVQSPEAGREHEVRVVFTVIMQGSSVFSEGGVLIQVGGAIT